MNSRKIIACAAQIAPIYMDLAATTAKICSNIKEAGKLGAQLVVFPEAALPGYPYWTLIHDPYSARIRFARTLYEQSVRLDSQIVKDLCKAAKEAGCVAVIGINEIDGGTIYNSQLVIDDDGEVRGCRRKLMPTHHERITWGRGDGDDLKVFDTKAGKVGALICYEHTNPLFRYAVQAQGEEIHVANWPGGMPWTDELIDAVVRMYAIEAATFVISTTAIVSPEIAAYLGEEQSSKLRIGGGVSSIVAPGGKYLARADADKEQLLCAEIDFSLIADWKHVVDSAGHYSRPDVLQLSVRTGRPSSICFLPPTASQAGESA